MASFIKKPKLIISAIAALVAILVFSLVSAQQAPEENIYEVYKWDEFILEVMPNPFIECPPIPEVIRMQGGAVLSDSPELASDTNADGILNDIPTEIIELSLSGFSECLGPLAMMGSGTGSYDQKFDGLEWPADSFFDVMFDIHQIEPQPGQTFGPLTITPCEENPQMPGMFISIQKHEEGTIKNFPPYFGNPYYAQGPILLCASFDQEPMMPFAQMSENIEEFSMEEESHEPFPDPGTDTVFSAMEMELSLFGGQLEDTVQVFGDTDISHGIPESGFDTEIVAMELTGTGDVIGEITVSLSDEFGPSDGSVISNYYDGIDFPAESFFDVFIDIELPSGEVLFNPDPIHLDSHSCIKEFPWYNSALCYDMGMDDPYTPIPLYQWDGPPEPVGFLNKVCHEPEIMFEVGDAPDSRNHFNDTLMTAYSATPAPATYPVVADPMLNVGPNGHGFCHFPNESYLGTYKSYERDADLTPDQDNQTNIDLLQDAADRDELPQNPPGDDGLVLPQTMLACAPNQITINGYADNPDMYVNVWVDWNQDGDWSDGLVDPGCQVMEWSLQNLQVPQGQFSLTPGMYVPQNAVYGQDYWIRVTLSDIHVNDFDEIFGPVGGQDTGCFEDGETEDYLETIYLVDEETDTDQDTIPDLEDNCPFDPNTDQTESDEGVPTEYNGQGVPYNHPDFTYDCDQLETGVCIGRDDYGPPYNYDNLELEWACGSCDNPTSDFYSSNGNPFNQMKWDCYGGYMPNIVQSTTCLYVPDSGNYYDINWDSWTQGHGGGFSYLRYLWLLAGDGYGDVCDNCPEDFNEDQADTDQDGIGDVCDNCPETANPGQEDSEGDEQQGEPDCNGGCVPVELDNSVYYMDAVPRTSDPVCANGCTNGEVFAMCSAHSGEVPDYGLSLAWNAQYGMQIDTSLDIIYSPDGQEVWFHDQPGCSCNYQQDLEDPIVTGNSGGLVCVYPGITGIDDGVGDACDNCPQLYNPDQEDDQDCDGPNDNQDNCPEDPNTNQEDRDDDGLGDVCDLCVSRAYFNVLDRFDFYEEGTLGEGPDEAYRSSQEFSPPFPTWNLQDSEFYTDDYCSGENGHPKTLHVYVETAEGWVEVDHHHFDYIDEIYKFDLTGNLPDINGEYKVKITHKGTVAAFVDYVKLGNNAPLTATLEDGTKVKNKVKEDDKDIADITNNSLYVSFNSSTNPKLTVKAREETEQALEVNKPFEFPGVDQYFSYELNKNHAIQVDGVIDSNDGIGEPNMAFMHFPTSGHPASKTYGYFNNDNNYLYVTVDATSDNTNDTSTDSDFVEIEVKNGSIYKSFKVTDSDTTYGQLGFGYTDKVAYEHKVAEIKIPLNEIGKSAGDTVEFKVLTYGTEGGSDEYYCQIAESDGSDSSSPFDYRYWAMTDDSYSENYNTQRFVFNVTDNVADNLRVYWEGRSSIYNDTATLYIWNDNTGDWDYVGEHSDWEDNIIQGVLPSADYIIQDNGDDLVVLVVQGDMFDGNCGGDGCSEAIFTDYVKVEMVQIIEGHDVDTNGDGYGDACTPGGGGRDRGDDDDDDEGEEEDTGAGDEDTGAGETPEVCLGFNSEREIRYDNNTGWAQPYVDLLSQIYILSTGHHVASGDDWDPADADMTSKKDFRAYEKANRFEALAIAMKAFCISPYLDAKARMEHADNFNFGDARRAGHPGVPDHVLNTIYKGYDLGLFEGRVDLETGEINSEWDEPIFRVESLALFMRVADMEGLITKYNNITSEELEKMTKEHFSDVDHTAWYAKYIPFVIETKLVAERSDKMAFPYEYLTRGEDAALALRMVYITSILDHMNQHSGHTLLNEFLYGVIQNELKDAERSEFLFGEFLTTLKEMAENLG